MTQRHCRACDGWHDLDKAWPRECVGHFGGRVNMNRSSLPSPMIILDGIDPVQSMQTGLWYDSKSALRAEYKALGVVELGNERPAPVKEDDSALIADVERDVALACEQLGL